MPKEFLSFQDQLYYLKSDKNLVINDPAYAEEVLKQVGYFGLIGGYKGPFKNPTTRKYKDGTEFEAIVNLYRFDESLRELFLKYILKIERHIRSLLSYYFTEKHGEQQSAYLSATSYNPASRYMEGISRLIGMLQKLATTDTDYPYINHQRTKYGNVPLWALFNAVSFGTLSKFYSYTTSDLQAKVAKNFNKVNQRQLEQYLSVMTKFRNVCAHGERLYSYKTRNDIPNTVLHRKLEIPLNGAQYTMGKNDLFSVVIAFRYLLTSEDFKRFKATLINILQHYLKSRGAMSEADVYSYMGFPANWCKIAQFKK